MKKVLTLIIPIFLFSLLIASVSADGMVHVYDQDMWGLFDEEQQLCAINYKDGFQHMILTVDTSEELRGEKAVWIFPVPAEPDKTVINIIKGFPQLSGHDVEEKADKSISEVFTTMRLTQIYTLPLWIITGGRMGSFRAVDTALGVTIYESIEKMGLTTELVSASDSLSLKNYLIDKGLNLPEASQSILEEYTGQEYSFVVSWISDIEKFNQEGISDKTERALLGNPIGVFITFPTDSIYYPLKLTSVYGDRKIPIAIYVLDFVKPRLYAGIKSNTQVNYFYGDGVGDSEELEGFFVGYDKRPIKYFQGYYGGVFGKERGFLVEGITYTKIKIDSNSEYLKDDLWMEVSTPLKVKFAGFFVEGYFTEKHKLFYGLPFFILCSCLASLTAGLIIFKDNKISKLKFVLLGLFNFSTLIGFSIAAYKFKIDKNFAGLKISQPSNTPFWKVLRRTALISFMIFVLLAGFWLVFIVFEIGDFPGIDFLWWWLCLLVGLIYIPMILLLAPLVWGHYNNRKIMKFIVLFSVLFVVFTLISQFLLTTLI
ncbi:DUF2330 domain-containing protein [Candidatus Woesearchaeota archaeon]|nr:DUF2330 domain-containing protein [Candidatus Woesearchaeota archaeon]